MTRLICSVAPVVALVGLFACDGGASRGGGPNNDNNNHGGAAGDSGAQRLEGWLFSQGNRIRHASGEIFYGRGANIHDTRSCDACSAEQGSVSEVLRRIDLLVDDWGANFLRLAVESYGSSGGRQAWRSVRDDPIFLTQLETIVAHIGQKQGVYVLLSLWLDPSFTSQGWPTDETSRTWEVLVDSFHADSHVLFGLVNEPERNFNGADDAVVWAAMNSTVAAIRAREATHGARKHMVVVQGTGGWSRRVDYYVDNPIVAGGGENIAYEIHIYDDAAEFQGMLLDHAPFIPIIIGEYGPASGFMTLDDCRTLMTKADALQISNLAWTFHMRCPPNLLVDNSERGCGVGMRLEPTEWGSLLMKHLAR